MITFIAFVISVHLLITIVLVISILSWKSENSDSRPSISIVIAAHNEFENLQRLIPKLIDQQYPDFEILVSLDRSDDDSSTFLASFKEKVSHININSTPEGWDHKKFALHSAITPAQGEWIVLTDADCVPRSNQWLQSIAREITPTRDILIGVSPHIASGSYLSRYSQFEAFITFFLYTSFSILFKPYMAVGRNMAFKKEYWKQKDGYEKIKSVKGGDDDLFIQMNATKKNTMLYLGHESLVDTLPKKDWKAYWSQKTRHFSVSKFYDQGILLKLTLYHLIHMLSILSIPFLIGSSFFLPIILFYLFIKLVSYRFVASKIGAGFNYIMFPFVDITYAFITPILGIWSKLKKDIKWKN